MQPQDPEPEVDLRCRCGLHVRVGSARRVMFRTVAAAALVVLLGACHGSEKSAAPTSVTSACEHAITAVVNIRGRLDPFQGILPSGLAASSFEQTIAASLIACTSRGQWMAAAHVLAPTADATTALDRFCANRLTDRPRVIPLDAPSCVRD
jgi:hypothetical protein